ncbi:hypothetical protein PAXINDRAFT_32590, partial [Paxillus involutus ATCC 200175]
DILCIANLQHNCIDSKCTEHSDAYVRQERILTTRTKAVVKHQPTLLYFLNMYSIHNYDLIRSILPD